MTVKSRTRERVAVISSTMPSASWSTDFSPDMLSKARTTIEGMSGAAMPAVRPASGVGRDAGTTGAAGVPAGTSAAALSAGVHIHNSIGSSIPLHHHAVDAMNEGGERLDELPADRMGDGDAARRRRLLQADDEADRGAEPVLTLNEDVGEADAAANEERRFAAPGIPLGHGGLKLDRPAHRSPRRSGIR